jgi:hypothetical protein
MTNALLTPGFNQGIRKRIESVTVSTVFTNANKPLKRRVNNNFADKTINDIMPHT